MHGVPAAAKCGGSWVLTPHCSECSAGRNSHGQLGVSHTSDVLQPCQISSQRWKAISLGECHSAGVGDGVCLCCMMMF